MKDCATCKYGFVDEQLGFPMCHHPSRFSEDCVDFNMHEEKEEPEKITGIEEKKFSEGLEEAAMRDSLDYVDNIPDGGTDKHPWNDHDVEKAYYDGMLAGAEWQRKQDQSLIELAEDHAMLAGMNKMKEEMMEKAVEGEVYKFGEVAYVKERNNAELTKYLSQFNNGDRVKIIVIKEEK